MAFDVSHPANPSYAGFRRTPRGSAWTREGEFPERLDFVPAESSPTKQALLLVTNEASGKTRAYELSATQ